MLDINSLEPLAELMEVNTAQSFRVCDAAQNSLVLNIKRQIERVDVLFEVADRDKVFGGH